MAKRTSKTLTAQQQDRRRKLRKIGRALGLVALCVGLVAAWVWHRTLPLEEVRVVGTHRAAPEDVSALAGVAPDEAVPVALYGIDLALVADRVRRHPWVREARLRRLPTGSLRIAVEERTPVALVLDADGRPHHYLDAAGFAMPVPASGAETEDVPLLRGRLPAYHPTQPIRNAGIRELLGALASADDGVDALISEVVWSESGATLYTEPVAGRGTIPVRLGRTGHADALTRLGAFWEQAVLTRPDVPLRLVDLRFAGQVVAQETLPPTRSAGGTSPEASGDTPTPAPARGSGDAGTTPSEALEPAAEGPGSGSTPVASPTPTPPNS